MEELSKNEPNIVRLRLAQAEPWGDFKDEESLGPLLLYRFKPPWFDGYDADSAAIMENMSMEIGPPPTAPPP